MQKIHIFHLCHKKGHATSITFHQKTQHQACLVFKLITFKRPKTYFLQYYISVETLQTPSYVLSHWDVSIQLCIVTQPRFQQTRIFMKLATFFILKTKQIYAKTFTVFRSTLKIKAISPWALFESLLTLTVIYKRKLLHKKEIV